MGLHGLSRGEPVKKLSVEVTRGADVHMMTNTMRADTLGTSDSLATELAVQNETDPQVSATDGDSSEVIVADQVDGRFDSIHSERTASLKCA